MPAFLVKHNCSRKKIPRVSILRPNLVVIRGAAQLQVLEVLHGEFMVVPETIFWVSFSLLWALNFPVHFYLTWTHTSF